MSASPQTQDGLLILAAVAIVPFVLARRDAESGGRGGRPPPTRPPWYAGLRRTAVGVLVSFALLWLVGTLFLLANGEPFDVAATLFTAAVVLACAAAVIAIVVLARLGRRYLGPRD